MMLKIAIGSDHRGFDLKQKIIMAHKEISWIDVGCYGYEPVDYPDYSHAVCEAVLSRKAHYGILLCGSGIGMSIAANRYPGIYAALCWNETIAREAKEDDNANILVLSADIVDENKAADIIKSWISASFKGGNYEQRLRKIERF